MSIMYLARLPKPDLLLATAYLATKANKAQTSKEGHINPQHIYILLLRSTETISINRIILKVYTKYRQYPWIFL